MEAQDVAGNQLLKKKYNLHASPEVGAAAKRTHSRTGEKIPQDPNSQIQNYLNRFREILERPDEDDKQRGLEALKGILLDKFTTHKDEIPESYWRSQEAILRERGQQGDYQRLTKKQREQWKGETAEAVLSDQRSSLSEWIDYLSSPDSSYIPDPMKYWVFRNVIGLSEYDNEKKEFPKRSKGTLKNFPEINQEALAYVVDAVGIKLQGKSFDFENFQYDLNQEEKTRFKENLKNENFSGLYAWANEQISPIPLDLLPVTEGQWVKYEHRSDPKELVIGIRGKGTGWCTAGESTARKHLGQGDFHVYYSKDYQGNPTIPRIAIRMEQNKIAEVRGIAKKQNLDPYVGDVLREKLQEFPDREIYLKKEKDSRQLTELDNKTKNGETLSKDDLKFLYAIGSTISGFGQTRDPRINELRSGRNTNEDLLIIFDCEPQQIAHSPEEVNENTRVFVSSIQPGFFEALKKYKVENVYSSFPERKITINSLEYGGKTGKELREELENKGVLLGDGVADYLDNSMPTTENSITANLVNLSMKQLGFDSVAKLEDIKLRAVELGLELCPAELGPYIRLKSYRQTIGSSYSLAMEPIQIDNRRGRDWSSVLRLRRDYRGIVLDSMPLIGSLVSGNQIFKISS